MTETGSGPRRAGGADRSDVARLWLALTRHHAERDPLFALRPGAEAEVLRLVGAQLRDPATAIFVAGPRGGLGGFASVHVAHAPPIHRETLRAEISDLFVAPAWRRGGWGRALVDAATRWAAERGAPRVEVRVAARNPEGQAFWRALGYAEHMDVLERRL